MKGGRCVYVFYLYPKKMSARAEHVCLFCLNKHKCLLEQSRDVVSQIHELGVRRFMYSIYTCICRRFWGRPHRNGPTPPP